MLSLRSGVQNTVAQVRTLSLQRPASKTDPWLAPDPCTWEASHHPHVSDQLTGLKHHSLRSTLDPLLGTWNLHVRQKIPP